MKISFPYIYSANVIVGKKRTAQDLFYVDHVVADIPHTVSEQAPVVVEWQGGNDADRDRHARFFEGNFYVPAAKLYRDAAHFDEVAFAAPDRISTIEHAHGLAALYGYRIGTPEWHAVNEAVTGKVSSRNQVSDIKELVKSHQDAAMARASDIAHSLISVDGVLYRRVQEPVFAVTVIGAAQPNVRIAVHAEGCSYGTVIDLDHGDEPLRVGDPANTRFYPLTQQAEAIEFANSFGFPVSNDVVGEMRIGYPDLIQFDREFEAATRAAEFAVERLRPIIAKFDRQTIECWLRIREPMAVFKHTGDRAIVEELVETEVPTLLELLGNREPGVVAGVEAGLGDWDGGTIGIDLAPRRPSP